MLPSLLISVWEEKSSEASVSFFRTESRQGEYNIHFLEGLSWRVFILWVYKKIISQRARIKFQNQQHWLLRQQWTSSATPGIQSLLQTYLCKARYKWSFQIQNLQLSNFEVKCQCLEKAKGLTVVEYLTQCPSTMIRQQQQKKSIKQHYQVLSHLTKSKQGKFLTLVLLPC